MFACCSGGRNNAYISLDEEWLRRNNSLSALELLQVQSRFGGATAGDLSQKAKDAPPQDALPLHTVAVTTSALLDLQNKARTKGYTFFVSGKYSKARKLLDKDSGLVGGCSLLEEAAGGLQDSLEKVRALLVALLFNRDYWHPSVAGGGLHTLWNAMPDGFDGMFNGAPIDYPDPITGEPTEVPGFDGIQYEAVRGEMLDAWKPVQVQTKVLADLVQRFSDHFYSKVEGTPMDVESIKAPDGTTQHVPEECQGRAYVAALSVYFCCCLFG